MSGSDVSSGTNPGESASRDVCARCARPLESTPATVHCNGGAFAGLPSEFHVCNHCARSLTHWLNSKQHVRARPTSLLGQGEVPSSRRGKRTRRDVLLRELAIYGTLAVLTFLFIWQMISRKAPPPSE